MSAANHIPRVSVIIPAYERQVVLTEAVRSVRTQEGRGERFTIELIIVDDASPTPQARDLSVDGLDARVERHDANQGAAAARNTGVSVAKGDYIAFLDSDDSWRPQKLLQQVIAAKTHSADDLWTLATGFHIKRSRSQQWQDLLPVEMLQLSDFLKGCRHSPGTTSFMPRRVFDVVGPFDTTLDRLEDYEWFLRFGKLSGKLYCVPEILADIDPSNSIATDMVLDAIDKIAAKHAPHLTHHEQTLLLAYLNFERGATLIRSGQRVRGGLALAQSLLSKPRLQTHLAPIDTHHPAPAS